MTCDHAFVFHDEMYICEHCGLESDDMIQDRDNMIPSISDLSLSSFLQALPLEYSKEIMSKFETIQKCHNVRGRSKRSLLAACFFFILLDKNKIFTCKDIQEHFNIDKRKFSEGKRVFLTYNKKYRVNDRKISDYLEPVFERFNFPKAKYSLIYHECRKLDANKSLINLNPFVVCACFTYKKLIEFDHIQLKKGVFTKRLGVSEVTIQNIFRNLLPH